MLKTKTTENAKSLRWLKVSEAEQYYHCSRLTLLAMARKAEALKDLGTENRSWYRIDKAKLDAYLKNKNAGKPIPIKKNKQGL